MWEPSLSRNHALTPDSGILCPKRSAPQAALSQGDDLLPQLSSFHSYAELRTPTSGRGPLSASAWQQ